MTDLDFDTVDPTFKTKSLVTARFELTPPWEKPDHDETDPRVDPFIRALVEVFPDARIVVREDPYANTRTRRR